MIRYLLDTNTCIELIRRRSIAVLSRLSACEIGEVGLSAITLAELEHGVAKSRDSEQNRAILAEFCAPLAVLPFGEPEAHQYGVVRTKLEQLGQLIGPLDLLIAAHALALGSVLVTDNEREFRRVAGLVVENWTL